MTINAEQSAITGVIKRQPQDFRVEEILGFEPSGQGEHLLIQVEKCGINTQDAVRQIGKYAGVDQRDIGFCGMKDKQAIASQWFSIRNPAREPSSWPRLDDAGMRVTTAARHSRKLKRGSHRGNRFEIRVREFSGDREIANELLTHAAAGGVPNFFGPQRFGRSNLDRADDLFAGRLGRVSRSRRGMLLSAARSSIFNEVLARRQRSGNWRVLMRGDAAMLDGSSSYFFVDEVDTKLQHRLEQLDIHPSGPLFGAGENPAAYGVGELEGGVFDSMRSRCEGLIKCGLRMERRSLRLRLSRLEWSWPAASELALSFELPRGGYATAVLGYIGRLEEPHRNYSGSN